MAKKPARPRVVIDAAELEALETLADRAMARNPELADRLLAELARAKVMPAGKLPEDVVRLGNLVTYRDETTGREQTVSLVLPPEADIDAGRISVFTPIGVALLGLQAGAQFDWETRGGEVRQLTVLSVRPAAPQAA